MKCRIMRHFIRGAIFEEEHTLLRIKLLLKIYNVCKLYFIAIETAVTKATSFYRIAAMRRAAHTHLVQESQSPTTG